jgi:tRNA-specific 2-thiouridylase
MKIAVGMSGGVDSSVVAKMLVDEGHEVVGLFLKLWTDPTSPEGLRGTSPTLQNGPGTGPSCKTDNRCCNYEALEDARKVANQLGIPFYVINASEAFKKAVVDNFLEEYKALRTPNPCVVCNDKIKFDLLLQKALSIGCEKLATGHYARIVKDNSGSSKVQGSMFNKIPNSKFQIQNSSFKLLAGVDETKDQSYMLYRLGQHQLSKILFPLGEMTKKEVRAKAVKWDLPVKEKPESQEICFVSDDYRSFLKRYLPETFVSGDIVDQSGKVVGKHEGLINYTVGQRKGIEQIQQCVIPEQSGIQDNKGIPPLDDSVGMTKQNEDRKPLYVVGFEKEKNQLIVGEDQATYQSEMVVSDLHWINSRCRPEHSEGSPANAGPIFMGDSSVSPQNDIKVKIRYRHPAVECTVQKNMPVIPAEAGIQWSLDPQPSEGGSTSGRRFGLRPSARAERGDDNIKVLFKKPQRAITPGQSAVFYLGEQVLGGGLISGY